MLRLSKLRWLRPPIKDNPVPSIPTELKDLNTFIGQYVSVKGKMFGTKDFGSMRLVNWGAAYPDQLATVVLKGKAKQHFGTDFIDGKTLTAVGVLSDDKGKPQLVVTYNKQLLLSEN